MKLVCALTITYGYASKIIITRTTGVTSTFNARNSSKCVFSSKVGIAFDNDNGKFLSCLLLDQACRVLPTLESKEINCTCSRRIARVLSSRFASLAIQSTTFRS